MASQNIQRWMTPLTPFDLLPSYGIIVEGTESDISYPLLLTDFYFVVGSSLWSKNDV
jgi:hypothetical protein